MGEADRYYAALRTGGLPKALSEYMTEHVQKCGACGDEVKGELYHLGFSDMDAVYCCDCPNVLLIKGKRSTNPILTA